MKHMQAFGPALCETQGSVEVVVDATRAVYMDVDCPACLRRAIAETDARGHVLRELLEKLEALA